MDKFGIKLDPWQSDLIIDKRQRIIAVCSRRSGKSTVLALRILHLAVHKDKTLSIIISPTHDQSKELFHIVNDFRRELEPAVETILDNILSFELTNGSRVATYSSNEKKPKGLTPHLIICDESQDLTDTMMDTTLSPMLALKTVKAQMILSGTGHYRSGPLFKNFAQDKHNLWAKYMITADQCPRIDQEYLFDQQRTLTRADYLRQYFCEFIDPDTNVFDDKLILAALKPKLYSPPGVAPFPTLTRI